MEKVVPPRFLSKAKKILGKFARGKGFGKFPLDNLKLILEKHLANFQAIYEQLLNY